MKRSLAHLPAHKKAELKEITAIIRQFAPVDMIILFGSHARGDWVEDVTEEDGVIYEYRSDYDILCVTETHAAARSNAIWRRVEQELDKARLSRSRVSLIAHCIDEVNRKIRKCNFFFTDVKREGIWLYNSRSLRLARVRKPHPNARYGQARTDFTRWFTSAEKFYKGFDFYLREDDFNHAAFLLHQTAEHLYHTLLLVHTGYKPKEHNLETLGHKVGGFDADLLKVFPRATKKEDRCFILLKLAYISARYHKEYTISREQLDYLAERVRYLRDLTDRVCRRQIEDLAARAGK